MYKFDVKRFTYETFYPLWISLIHLAIFTIAINKESNREQTFSKPNYMKAHCIFSVLIIELQISKKPKNFRNLYIWWRKKIIFCICGREQDQKNNPFPKNHPQPSTKPPKIS